jgi:hypothetical protein
MRVGVHVGECQPGENMVTATPTLSLFQNSDRQSFATKVSIGTLHSWTPLVYKGLPTVIAFFSLPLLSFDHSLPKTQYYDTFQDAHVNSKAPRWSAIRISRLSSIYQSEQNLFQRVYLVKLVDRLVK